MPSPTFGLVAEGTTDHAVLTQILAGAFDDRNIDARPLQPLTSSADRGKPASFGGWQNVLAYLSSHNLEQALQIVNYVVVQIDTDVAQELGVSTHRGGMAIATEELCAAVRAHLVTKVGDPVWNRISGRVVFAIAVSSTECWLLVLHGRDNERTGLQNCLQRLNRCLSRNGRPVNGDNKDASRYADLCQGLR